VILELLRIPDSGGGAVSGLGRSVDAYRNFELTSGVPSYWKVVDQFGSGGMAAPQDSNTVGAYEAKTHLSELRKGLRRVRKSDKFRLQTKESDVPDAGVAPLSKTIGRC
jgi:hypothetical protein